MPVKGEAMIKELFSLYSQDKSTYVICKSRFMRKLTEHNEDNDDNLEYLYNSIVPAQAKKAGFPEKILNDPTALLWIRELDATVVDPVTMRSQKDNCLRYASGNAREFDERAKDYRREINGLKSEWMAEC